MVDVVFVALCVLQLVIAVTAQTPQPSIALLESSPNVTSGEPVCANTLNVSFTCVGVELNFLRWRLNGNEIITFIFEEDTPQPAPVSTGTPGIWVQLVAVNENSDESAANFTSILVADFSSLNNNDSLTCQDNIASKELVVSYTNQSAPPAPVFSNTTQVHPDNSVTLTLTWDDTFTSTHDVDVYSVTSTGGVSCSSGCGDPNTPCVCTGLAAGGEYNFTVRAINCGDHEGPDSDPIVVTTQTQPPQITTWNIVLTILGAISWVSATLLLIIGTTTLAMCITRDVVPLSKLVYLYAGLLVGNVILLLITAGLWIAFGNVVDNPQRYNGDEYIKTRDGLCVAATVCSLIVVGLSVAMGVFAAVLSLRHKNKEQSKHRETENGQGTASREEFELQSTASLADDENQNGSDLHHEPTAIGQGTTTANGSTLSGESDVITHKDGPIHLPSASTCDNNVSDSTSQETEERQLKEQRVKDLEEELKQKEEEIQRKKDEMEELVNNVSTQRKLYEAALENEKQKKDETWELEAEKRKMKEDIQSLWTSLAQLKQKRRTKDCKELEQQLEVKEREQEERDAQILQLYGEMRRIKQENNSTKESLDEEDDKISALKTVIDLLEGEKSQLREKLDEVKYESVQEGTGTTD